LSVARPAMTEMILEAADAPIVPVYALAESDVAVAL
jgi:hypothetical protein